MSTLTTGAGSPVTVFAPGRGETIAGTRPFGSGVPGTKVFLRYESDPVHDVRTVADDAGATQAFGASLGAAAVIGVLATTPDRFDRVVLALPARLEMPLAAMVAVDVPVLVIGQYGDDLHPADVAEQTAAAFDRSRLEMFDAGGLFTAHRAELRALVSGFLG